MSFRTKTPQELEITDLLKRATVQAKTRDYDAAIAGLLRAYSLMETVYTEWGIKPYFRVARYHHLAGRYEDALNWLQQLYENVDINFNAREKLYEEWGMMQGSGSLKIPEIVRNNYRKVIKKEIELLITRQKKIEQRINKTVPYKTQEHVAISEDLYTKYLTQCLGKSPDECIIVALTGGEIVEALWSMNKRFQASMYRLATLPYDARYEKEADTAIVSYVFNNDNWAMVSIQAWRVLLERQRQAIVFFQLQANEPCMPIPQELTSKYYLGAVLLFLFPQWKLPFKTSSEEDLLTWQNTLSMPNNKQ